MSQDAIFSKLVSSSGTKHIIHHPIALFLFFQNIYDSKFKMVAYASRNLSDVEVLEIDCKSRMKYIVSLS